MWWRKGLASGVGDTGPIENGHVWNWILGIYKSRPDRNIPHRIFQLSHYFPTTLSYQPQYVNQFSQHLQDWHPWTSSFHNVFWCQESWNCVRRNGSAPKPLPGKCSSVDSYQKIIHTLLDHWACVSWKGTTRWGRLGSWKEACALEECHLQWLVQQWCVVCVYNPGLRGILSSWLGEAQRSGSSLSSGNGYPWLGWQGQSFEPGYSSLTHFYHHVHEDHRMSDPSWRQGEKFPPFVSLDKWWNFL